MILTYFPSGWTSRILMSPVALQIPQIGISDRNRISYINWYVNHYNLVLQGNSSHFLLIPGRCGRIVMRHGTGWSLGDGWRTGGYGSYRWSRRSIWTTSLIVIIDRSISVNFYIPSEDNNNRNLMKRVVLGNDWLYLRWCGSATRVIKYSLGFISKIIEHGIEVILSLTQLCWY